MLGCFNNHQNNLGYPAQGLTETKWRNYSSYKAKTQTLSRGKGRRESSSQRHSGKIQNVETVHPGCVLTQGPTRASTRETREQDTPPPKPSPPLNLEARRFPGRGLTPHPRGEEMDLAATKGSDEDPGGRGCAVMAAAPPRTLTVTSSQPSPRTGAAAVAGNAEPVAVFLPATTATVGAAGRSEPPHPMPPRRGHPRSDRPKGVHQRTGP